METWRFIPGYSSHEVSNLGRVRSHKWGKGQRPLTEPRIRRLSVARYKAGIKYHVVGLCGDDGKIHFHYVHALVALAFIGPRPEGMHVCHHPDNNGLNNCLENLRYDTPAANMREGKVTKLTYKDVLNIRQRHAKGETPTQLASFFPVCRENIRLICAGAIWQVA